MSEKNCPDCGHYIDVHKGCQHPGCPCTRTYESLVGEKGGRTARDLGIECECSTWSWRTDAIAGHHFSCPSAPNRQAEEQMETELQLLIIDLGDSCVVKVEKGEWDATPFVAKLSCTALPKSFLFGISFTAFREAIEQKPVPRIERDLTCIERHFHHYFGDGNGCLPLNAQQYDDLTKINGGKPLPVWKGGTWEEVGHIDDDVYNNTDLRVWRYTL